MSPFEAIATALTAGTSLTSTQARGTMRLLCRDAGVPAVAASKADMQTVLGGPLLAALEARRVVVAPGLLVRLRAALDDADEGRGSLYGIFDDMD